MVLAKTAVGDFLDLVKTRTKNTSLQYVYLNGAAVDLASNFTDYYTESTSDCVYLGSPVLALPRAVTCENFCHLFVPSATLQSSGSRRGSGRTAVPNHCKAVH
jgi:hypothetical protein